jgi:purine nucleosidase
LLFQRLPLVLALVISLGGSVVGAAAEPLPLIFDTDICGDCDDVLALAMIHSLESRGACRLVAVTVSADHPLAAPFVDAVNTFYGRGGVPIGVVGKGGVKAESRYLGLAEEAEGGRLRYPHDLTSSATAPAATAVLRKALASQPDGSVVVVQVGFSTNLARLLDSGPDAVSPLSGTELVRKKVRFLSLMAGAFIPIEGNPRFLEYNVKEDAPSCAAVASKWPTPMIWSGFEIGIALPYPSVSIERDYAYVTHHPVAESYIRHEPPPHNRPTWDLTSVLHAVQSDRGYFDLSEPGNVTVERDGFTRFAPDPNGRHRYLKLRDDQRPRVLEAEVLLSSQPPRGREDR